MQNLNWAMLNQILSSRGTAEDAAEDAEFKLEKTMPTRKPIVTQHVAEASFRGSNYKRNRRSRLDYGKSDSGYERPYSESKSSVKSCKYVVKVMIAIMTDITTGVINDDLVSFQDLSCVN